MSVPARPITAIDEKYRVIARVGRGGVADVNLAVARGPGGFNKLVVLKSLREEFRGAEDYRKMFMAEARLNAQLSHPHIVQTNEIFEFDGLPVIVMEYLEGQSLGAVVRMLRKVDGAAVFDQSMHLRVLSDILHALDYAHNTRGLDGKPLSLVHCDVTPQNVFLTYEGEVKLLDFGIAQQLTVLGERAVGEIRGKLRYMPPEQIKGVGLDQRADIFAVGVMAWEAAAGVRLWSGATDDHIKQAVKRGDIPLPSSVTDGVDPELERIVMRALEPDKESRYSSALAMQLELDGFLGISGTQLRSRDIGAAVSTLFAKRRAQTQLVIADQLAVLAALSEGGSGELQLVDLPQTPLASLSVPPEPSKRRRVLPLLAAILAAVFAAFGAVVAASGAVPWDSGDESSQAETVPEIPSVELRITAFPEQAEIALDGVVLGANPYSQAHQRSAAKREIRVTAPGHETAVRSVVLEQATNVVIALTPLTPPAPLPSAVPEPVRSVVAPPPLVPGWSGATKTAPKRLGCDPPAYFDEKGLKHFKPHCL